MRNGILMLFLGVFHPALLAAQVAAGGEFRVNSYTTGFQYSSSAAVTGDGRFVVVWQSRAESRSNRILGRRFDSAGVALGAEFQVNTASEYLQYSPVVGSAPNGDFVVVWQVQSSLGLWTHAQAFDAAGIPRGQNFVVQAGANWPAVACDRAGNCIVVSRANGIVGQRFSTTGVPLGAPFQVNTDTTYDPMRPAIAAAPGHEFLVVWQGMQWIGARYAIFGRRFTATGAPLGDQFRVNTDTAPRQGRAQVAVAGGGDFVVAWEALNDGSRSGIVARRFSPAGIPMGSPFVVNSYTTDAQYIPRVATDEVGNFVIAWSSLTQDGSNYGVFARRFSAAGTARGAEFRVNTTTFLSQVGDAVLSDGAGNFTVTWSDHALGGGEVAAQRFGGLQPAALAVDAGANGVLEPGESVDVQPSWRNVNGIAQAFAGVAAAITGPQPATYELLDSRGDYGTVPDGATRQCSDCYRVGVPTTIRPILHWDAVLEEAITPDAQGQDKLWRLHVGNSFEDVPPASLFYGFIETLLHHSVTAGCGADTYCPGGSATREQTALFVLVAREGSGHAPPACVIPMFLDVPASSPFCRWIEELARRGVVSGCGGGNYCPNEAVTRDQMAVFVLRTLDPALEPPACTTPVFADVPASSPFCRWIEELARRGVVAGCGGGNYCPTAPVTREQMAVFLTATFGLTLYGP